MAISDVEKIYFPISFLNESQKKAPEGLDNRRIVAILFEDVMRQ
jgi:hypothetical protein